MSLWGWLGLGGGVEEARRGGRLRSRVSGVVGEGVFGRKVGRKGGGGGDGREKVAGGGGAVGD